MLVGSMIRPRIDRLIVTGSHWMRRGTGQGRRLSDAEVDSRRRRASFGVRVLAPQHPASVTSALNVPIWNEPGPSPVGRSVMTAALRVTWLLRNPGGQVAPEEVEGDIVRVSDGITTIYLTPRESAGASTSRGSARREQCLKPGGY